MARRASPRRRGNDFGNPHWRFLARLVNNPRSSRAPPMATQAMADGPLERAVSETKRYMASIASDPEACPMFPVVNEYNGTGEALCYIQGYLAGLVAAAGQKPTKARMDELVLDTLNDPSMRDIILKVQADVKYLDTPYPPREF